MNVLAVEAHPDDIEFMCAGTLARLEMLGYSISILSISAGECGSSSMTSEETLRTRLDEGEKAAAILKGKFYHAGIKDKHIAYVDEQRYRVCEIFRSVKPDIVFALSPKDYILDHDFASLLARDAATAASVSNFRTGMLNPAPPTDRVPHLYYCEPIGRADIFGDPVLSTVYVR